MGKVIVSWTRVGALVCLLNLNACQSADTTISKHNGGEKFYADTPHLVSYSEQREQCDHYTAERLALFGDLHVHTAYSFDASANSLETYPDDAHRFAKGEPIPFFPVDDNGRAIGTTQLKRPLDFVAVTDHGEFLGERALCRTPGSPKYDTSFCLSYRQTERQGMLLLGTIIDMEQPERFSQLCGDSGQLCNEYAKGPWREMIAASNNAYDRTSECKFTSLIGYEYTGTPGISNIHRNVIFRNGRVPELPISYIEAPSDQQLWAKLSEQCTDECDYITIPHNSNLSNGRMFSLLQGGKHDDGHHHSDSDRVDNSDQHTHPQSSIDDQRRHALARLTHEPIMEIFQHKGNSECINGLSSIFGEPDEYCEFEQIRKFDEQKTVVELSVVDDKLVTKGFQLVTEECEEHHTGRGGMVGAGCVSTTDFHRSNLLTGLKDHERLGVNSAKLGVIASTDTHNSTPGAVSESDWGGHVSGESTPEERLQPGLLTSGIDGNPGGLAGVWSVENSRDAVFDALERREVFGTSGPRIKPRLFASWDYPMNLCETDSMIKTAYQTGVPMGSDTVRTSSSTAIRLFVHAEADQHPLEKLQIVKGWISAQGDAHYKIYDVAGNLQQNSTITSHGHQTLCTVFEDPDFDVQRHSYYYLRVVEMPSTRWSDHDCRRIPLDQRPDVCGKGSTVPVVIQELAWTSPIWFVP